MLSGGDSVTSITEIHSDCVRGDLVFIAEDEIGVLNAVQDLVLEELEQENSRQVEKHGLVIVTCELAHLFERVKARSNEETSCVNHFSSIKSILKL